MASAALRSEPGREWGDAEGVAILTRFAAILLLLAIPAAAGIILDPRLVAGDPAWMKPAKFLVSLSLYAATMAWASAFVDARWRRTRGYRALVATVVAASLFEAAYIALQAARGQMSHFNMSDGGHALMYALMGVGALALTATAPWLGLAIARHGQRGIDPALKAGLVAGFMLTFLLGVPPAALMSAKLGHAIGVVPGGATLPVLGWSLTGGDLRPAHFLGIHAMQVLPLLGWLASGMRRGVAIVMTGAVLYAAATAWLIAQAMAGRPLLGL